MNKISKQTIRRTYRKIRHQTLTIYNQNSYHSKLQLNLYQLLLSHFSSPLSQQVQLQTLNSLLIGSYIHRPVIELIPPMPTTIYNHSEIKLKYAFPYFYYHDKKMKFYQHFTSDQYQLGPYGIKLHDKYQSKLDLSQALDVCLVPLVCFTQERHRVGEGGGYYDAFISETRKKQKDKFNKNTLFVGVTLQALKIPKNERVEFDEWDQKLDAIITECKIYAEKI